MKTIERQLEEAGAEIRDTSRAVPDRQWERDAHRRNAMTRPALVGTVFVATLLIFGGTTLLLATVRDGSPGIVPPSASTASTPPQDATPPGDASPPPTMGLVVPPDGGVDTLQVTHVVASSELPSFPATNLIDGHPDTLWNDASLKGDGAVLTFDFEGLVYLDTIVIHNAEDEEDFRRNYRARDLEIEYNAVTDLSAGSSELTIHTLTMPDNSESVTAEIGALSQGSVIIRVLSVWDSEPVDDMPPFDELAISEIEFRGIAMKQAAIEDQIANTNQIIDQLNAEIAALDEHLLNPAIDLAKELRDRRAAAEKMKSEALRRQAELEAYRTNMASLSQQK